MCFITWVKKPKKKKTCILRFKLIVGKESNVILGGEVIGGSSVGELVNTIGISIQNRMNNNSILTSQLGTHPLPTVSPAGDPSFKAACNVGFKTIFNNNP